MPAPFLPPSIALDPDGTYIQSNTREVPVIRRRSGRRPLGPNRLYRGTWIPTFGYPSVAQSNRGFLGSCAFYWRQVLTPAERAAWTANPGPGTTGFQRFMSWQKYNQGRKMVNPRIDLWDRVAPFPTAPGSYSPPTIDVAELHLWLTAPGDNSTYLQASLTTDPPFQYVHVGVTPFHKFPKRPGLRNWSTNFQLVTAEQEPLEDAYVINYDPPLVRNFGIARYPFPSGSQSFTLTFTAYTSQATRTLLVNPGNLWLSWDDATYTIPGAGVYSLGFAVDYDQLTPAGDNGYLDLNNLVPGFDTYQISTPAGTLNYPSTDRPRRVLVDVHFPALTLTDLWEFPFHVIGTPLASDRCWVRLLPVDIATGSAGTPFQTLVVPE